MLNFSVSGQVIERLDSEITVADSINLVCASITFDEDWQDKTITAYFSMGNVKRAVPDIISGVEFYVPWEVLKPGNLRLYVEGYDGNTRITTAKMTKPIRVLPSGRVDGASPAQTPTKDVYETLLDKYDIVVDTAETLQVLSDSGAFDGRSLEFEWNSTSLGVRKEGDAVYQYTDLKGEQGAAPTIDQVFDATSANAMSGVAVAQAMANIETPTVSQEYDATSANAMSGVAVAQAMANLNQVPTTWAEIQASVQNGTAPQFFPVGYEFTTSDSVMHTDVTWVVRAHNHHKTADSDYKRSMTLETKNLYSNELGGVVPMIFDLQEALYYAENGLVPGTYCFTVSNYGKYTADNGKTFEFTLTSAVPQGGQVMVEVVRGQTVNGATVKTYSSGASADVIEQTTLSEGSNGTNLGTTDGTGNVNHMHRIAAGSNNYAQSTLRQWLNSTDGWQQQTKWDRVFNISTSFLQSMPADFLAVLEPAKIYCSTNGVYECASLDGTVFTTNSVYTVSDKFFVLSRPEIMGDWDNSALKDGTQLDYYKGLSNSEIVKYAVGGISRLTWVRSAMPNEAGNVHAIAANGTLDYSIAYATNGIAPACIIA